MDMKPVYSSNIAAVGYDDTQQVMHVEFTNGVKYVYFGVPAEEHKALIGADSVGSHFGKTIRGKYDHEKA